MDKKYDYVIVREIQDELERIPADLVKSPKALERTAKIKYGVDVTVKKRVRK